MKGIAVTGMGIVSAIGNDLVTNLKSLKDGKSGISKPEILQTRHIHLPVGEVKITNEELRSILQLSDSVAYTRAAMLGIYALKDLQKNCNIDRFATDTAFISGTSVGGMDKTEQHFYEFNTQADKRKYIRSQHPGFTTETIARYFGLREFVTTISTACSSGANAIMMGARLIESGRAKRVIVGGTDCLTKFTLNGFHSLKILSEQPTRPFDENRGGLNLGEAAAYLLLEEEDVIENRKILGRITGFGNANDAFHQTASSENGEGAFLAMQKALQKARLNRQGIDYINAHGTGTINNDLSESIAIKRLFGNQIPGFSSTKAFTGHTLGAAGAIEAVYSLLAIQEQQVWKNLNFQNAMQETAYKPVTENQVKSVHHVLSNSFGFGGNCTSLIFKKDE